MTYPIVLLLSTLLCYFTAIQGQFVYDDEFLIQKNVLLTEPHLWSSFFHTSTTFGSGGQDSFYRPLQILLYGLVYQIDGLNSSIFHILNILLHGLNAVLIFIFLKNLLNIMKVEHAKEIGFGTALIWLAHPIHTEAITYISGTADPLYVLFTLCTLILCLKQGLLAYIASLAFMVLSLMSKETAVTSSGLVLITLLVSGKPMRQSLLRSFPYILLASSYITLRGNILNLDESFSFYSDANIYTNSILVRVYTAMSALTDYVSLIFWPQNLSIDKTASPVTAINFKVVLGLLLTVFSFAGLLWSFIKKQWLWFFPLAWFWCIHILHTGIPLPLNSFFLEHWMYLPLLAFAFAIVTTWFYLSRNKHLFFRLALPVFIFLTLGHLTSRQNLVWANPISLYTHILKFSPDVARVHNNLAMAYSDIGNLDLAEFHYKKALEYRDDYPQIYHNLGLVYLRKNETKKALDLFNQAVALKPNFFQSYLYIAKCYEILGESEKAKEANQLFETYKPKY